MERISTASDTRQATHSSINVNRHIPQKARIESCSSDVGFVSGSISSIVGTATLKFELWRLYGLR